MNPGKEERRTSRRIALRARIRVRAAGTNGIGTLCRLRDASASGIRLLVDGWIRDDCSCLEVLTASGAAPVDPIHVRVVRTSTLRHGRQELGCHLESGKRLRRRRILGVPRRG